MQHGYGTLKKPGSQDPEVFWQYFQKPQSPFLRFHCCNSRIILLNCLERDTTSGISAEIAAKLTKILHTPFSPAGNKNCSEPK